VAPAPESSTDEQASYTANADEGSGITAAAAAICVIIGVHGGALVAG
jgi:hypothetical protein